MPFRMSCEEMSTDFTTAQEMPHTDQRSLVAVCYSQLCLYHDTKLRPIFLCVQTPGGHLIDELSLFFMIPFYCTKA